MIFCIEQTLHGYYMGHGLLASSVPSMDTNSASLMATLSDWTGYRGLTDEEDNYLTVYPLPSRKYMAFAKTWYADEMERPGCVWTHTLLVPIDNFKSSFDIRNLSMFFKRPTENEYEEYNKTLEIDSADVCEYDEQPIFSKLDSVSFLFCVSVLLNKLKGACFGIDRKQSDLQLLLLSFLQYLPLGVLLNTSVSSGSEKMRKIGKDAFSLQFVSNRFVETLSNGRWKTELSENDFTEALRYLFREVCKKNDKSSYLIHQFNNDIEESSIKYNAVVNLLRLLDVAMSGKDNVSYEEVLSCIFGTFPKSGEGILVKANFLGKKVSDFFCSDSECLVDIARTNIEEADWKYVQLSQRIHNLSPSNLRDLAISLSVHGVISETPTQILLYTFEYLDAAEINGIVEYNWNKLKHLIIGNTTYMYKEYWLYLKKEHFNEYFQLLPIEYINSLKQWDMLLEIILSYETLVNEKWSEEIITHRTSAVNKILNYANKNGIEHISMSLLNACFSHVGKCLDWMVEQNNSLDASLLNLMTTFLDPNSMELRNYSHPFWRCLLKCNSKEPCFLSFVFVLAFLHSGSDSLDLLKKSFDDIYILQSKNRFSEKYWNRIAYYVDKINWVKEWDKCKRLCLCVVKYLYQNGYEKEAINYISNDCKIRERLMKSWKKYILR